MLRERKREERLLFYNTEKCSTQGVSCVDDKSFHWLCSSLCCRQKKEEERPSGLPSERRNGTTTTDNGVYITTSTIAPQLIFSSIRYLGEFTALSWWNMLRQKREEPAVQANPSSRCVSGRVSEWIRKWECACWTRYFFSTIAFDIVSSLMHVQKFRSEYRIATINFTNRRK